MASNSQACQLEAPGFEGSRDYDFSEFKFDDSESDTVDDETQKPDANLAQGLPEDESNDNDIVGEFSNGIKGWTKLHQAIEDEDFAAFMALVKSGEHNVDAFTAEERLTPLLQVLREAAWRNDSKYLGFARLLIDHGAIVNHKTSSGDTALHEIAQHTSEVAVEAARLLIDHGADPNIGRDEPDNAGHAAHGDGCGCGGHVGGVLQALTALAGGSRRSDDRKYEQDITPLHKACESGSLAIARLLIERGARIDAWDYHAGGPLHSAASRGHVDVCKFLVGENGKDGKDMLSKKDGYEQTPLHVAALCGQAECVKFLLERGAAPDEPVQGEGAGWRDGLTPILLACDCDNNEADRANAVGYLIAAGADINREGPRGQTALALSMTHGLLSVAQRLMAAGASTTSTTLKNVDATPLTIAATRGHAALCRWLIETEEGDVNCRDGDGYTPIILAAGYGNGDTVRELASLGADLEARIHDGRRASHFAAFKDKEDCLEALIELKVDLDAVDDNMWTPLHYAARYHHKGVLAKLLEQGVKVGLRVTDGPTYKMADQEEKEVDGFTAADLAKTRRGGGECVEMLLEYGDELSETTKALVDEDLLEETNGCIVM